jgi:hypothetical protein
LQYSSVKVCGMLQVLGIFVRCVQVIEVDVP